MAELKDKKYPTWINSDVITKNGINYGDCELLYELLLSEVIDGFYERRSFFEKPLLRKILNSLDGVIFLNQLFCKDRDAVIMNDKLFNNEVSSFESVIGCCLHQILDSDSSVWMRRMRERAKMLIILKVYKLISEYKLVPIDDKDYPIDVFNKLNDAFYKHLDNLNAGDDYDITNLFTRLVNLKNEIHRLEEIRKKIHEKDFKFDYYKWMKIYRLMIIEISTTLGFPKEPEYWTDNFKTLDGYLMLKTIDLLLLNPNGISPEGATYAIEDEKILCMKTDGKFQIIIRELNDKQNAFLREKVQILKTLNWYKFIMGRIRSAFFNLEVFIPIQRKIDKDLKTHAKTLYDEYNYDVEELLRVPGRGKIDLH